MPGVPIQPIQPIQHHSPEHVLCRISVIGASPIGLRLMILTGKFFGFFSEKHLTFDNT